MTFHIPKKALLLGSAKLKPQDVFATSLYTGNGTSRTITTGTDLAGKGGLVWLKQRSQPSGGGPYPHVLTDTVRGVGPNLYANLTGAENNDPNTLSAFSSTGFSIGTNAGVNGTPDPFVAWSFRRAPKFFDIVTYTGNGVAGRQIAHNLGTTPGMVVIKKRNAAQDWFVAHRSLTGANVLKLNTTDAQNALGLLSVGTSSYFVSDINAVGETYVAYLFAQNTDLIDCGSYVGNGSTTGPVVTCGSGWRPQWLMTKPANTVGDWTILDASRSPSDPRQSLLLPNSSSAEIADASFNTDFVSSGFQPRNANSQRNGAGNTYIYMAIREPY